MAMPCSVWRKSAEVPRVMVQRCPKKKILGKVVPHEIQACIYTTLETIRDSECHAWSFRACTLALCGKPSPWASLPSPLKRHEQQTRTEKVA